MATYRFGNLAGSGSYCDVYDVTRKSDGWEGVAKKLKPPYSKSDLARFKREVRLLGTLKHPNIIEVVGANLTDDPPWYVMPRAVMNLKEYLEKNHGESQMPIFLEIAEALAFAHENGVLHRDLKPENILIVGDFPSNFRPVISDFGLGRFTERDSITLGSVDISS